MVILGDLFVFVLLVISTIASIIVFNPLYHKKSFFQIYENISNSATIKLGKIKDLGSLHDCLENKTDEQIMINNFYFRKKNIEYWYKVFLVISVPLIIYMTLKCNLSTNARTLLIFFALSIIMSMLLVFYFIICNILGVTHIQLRNSFGIIISIFIKNFLIIFVTFTFFMLLLYLYILVNKSADIELLNKMISVSLSEMKDSIYGIKFSLSSLFFTLAIGSTVIFSIIDRYLMDKKRIEKELEIQLEVYKKWYNKYEFKEKAILYLNIQDAFNVYKLNKFYYAITELRSNLSGNSIKKSRYRIFRYKFFICLIVLSYFGGIFTIFIPVD